jgi:hypothetical protein
MNLMRNGRHRMSKRAVLIMDKPVTVMQLDTYISVYWPDNSMRVIHVRTVQGSYDNATT